MHAKSQSISILGMPGKLQLWQAPRENNTKCDVPPQLHLQGSSLPSAASCCLPDACPFGCGHSCYVRRPGAVISDELDAGHVAWPAQPLQRQEVTMPLGTTQIR
eukprot:CAMPEP_0172899028 /NCGR_PEP_ID=MMETSP1075-20121228/160884_1 /TAXON_ID=2916 /ORGANISM="Ceratium fusus, Strain PA161109" /LENGTH=103 /DNA_ID=CAMNT_0013754933 /DNA_START=133 /DNA_END=444 /DNA_ORIENTATION=-